MKLIDISTATHPNTFTMVDDADFVWLSNWKWFAVKSGNSHPIYAARGVRESKNGKVYHIRMHREIMKASAGVLCDHKDRNSLNNQKENLRFCSRSENACNRAKPKIKNPTSKYKGVSKIKCGKYVAMITYNNKTVYIGAFDKEDDAAKAYNKASIEKMKTFSFQNTIQGE